MNYLLETIVIILLMMTVMFCWRLNSKITEIKSSRKDMASLVKIFDEAIINTNGSLNALKEASAIAAIDLKKYGIKSNELIKELAFMNDTAVRLADRLENIVIEAREIEIRCADLIKKAKSVKKPIKKRVLKIQKSKGKIIKVPVVSKEASGDIERVGDDLVIKKRTVNRK